jgi:hypothetical protein
MFDPPQLNTDGDDGQNVQQDATGDEDDARGQRLTIARVDTEVPAADPAADGTPVAPGARPPADDSDDDFRVGFVGDGDDEDEDDTSLPDIDMVQHA